MHTRCDIRCSPGCWPCQIRAPSQARWMGIQADRSLSAAPGASARGWPQTQRAESRQRSCRSAHTPAVHPSVSIDCYTLPVASPALMWPVMNTHGRQQHKSNLGCLQTITHPGPHLVSLCSAPLAELKQGAHKPLWPAACRYTEGNIGCDKRLVNGHCGC